MLMVTWSAQLEREGKAPGLSNFTGGSCARACMEFLSAGLAGSRRPPPHDALPEPVAERARMLHRAGWGYRRIAVQLQVTPWQARGAIRRTR